MGINIKVTKWNSGGAFYTIQFSKTSGMASMWMGEIVSNWVWGGFSVIHCRTILMMTSFGLIGLVHHVDMTHVMCLYDITQWHVEIIAKLTEAGVCFLSMRSAHHWLAILLSQYCHGSATPSSKDTSGMSGSVFHDMACIYLCGEDLGKYMKNTESELAFV